MPGRWATAPQLRVLCRLRREAPCDALEGGGCMSRCTLGITIREAILGLALSGALVAGTSCRDDSSAGPSEPGTVAAAAPALTSATTAALSFYQLSPGYDHTCGVTTDN